MEKKDIKACSSNVAKVKVTINRYSDGEVNGQLSNAYDNKIYTFNSMWNMIKIMDSVFDGYAFPQASHEMRSFTGLDNATDTSIEPSQIDENGDAIDNGAAHVSANFIIYVYYRQNATWQGEILWVEGKQERKFRSTMEMQRLMDSVLERSPNS